MAGFSERVHLKGKADEDQYFAKLDRDRIAALHEMNIHEKNSEKHAPDTRCRVAGGLDKLANRPIAAGS
jgi:hypothetical protein